MRQRRMETPYAFTIGFRRTIFLAGAVHLIAASAAIAQARIVGVVRDSASKPIAGAEISVEDMTRTATSGAKGEFQLGGIKPGTITVTVRRLGYAPVSTVIRVADGDNTVPDVVLVTIPRELDPVAIREQELWRQRPLLREFEENRKLGLGQFVTRAQLQQVGGGFISQVFDNMRGLLVVRSGQFGSHAWIANSRTRTDGGLGQCTVLEDRLPKEPLSPRNADCSFCYPQVYVDYSRISRDNFAPNISRWGPDQLEAIEFYQGGAQAPRRYDTAISGCGVVVLHTRAIDPNARRIASGSAQARSRFLASASLSLGRAAKGCEDCALGSATDVTLGYTLKHRWVIGGRYAAWSASGGAQKITLRQAMMEWYPNPEAGRLKWFINAGLGNMSLALNTTHGIDWTDTYDAKALPSITAGTGTDISLVRGFVLTPFMSHTRSVGGHTEGGRCTNGITSTGAPTTSCIAMPAQPRVFSLTQIGTRVGWR
jgi:hypothetical protein